MCNKIGELESFLIDKTGFEVLCITEHWLTKSECNERKCGDYAIRSYYARSKGYGGSAILTGDKYDVVNLDEVTNLSVEKVCEFSARLLIDIIKSIQFKHFI